MLLAIEGAMRKFIFRDDQTKEILATIQAESLSEALEESNINSNDHPHIRVSSVEI